MPTIDNYISVTLSLVNPGVARAGFGGIMILSATADWTERTRTYSDAAGLISDGFAASSPEVLAASAIFAQTPHPTTIKVGRSALPPTLVYVVSVANVINSHVYTVNVEGEGVTTTEAETAASDGSATNDEVVALLVTALNGVVGKNYTAVATGSVGSKVCTVTATGAGDWFSLEVDPDLKVKMTHSDPGVATDLAAIQQADQDWYTLYTLFNSKLYSMAAAAWCESNGYTYLPDFNETEAVTTAASNGDSIDAIGALGYTGVMCGYYPSPARMFGARWLGRYLSTEPGKAVAALKTLSGIESVSLTPTQRGNLVEKRGNSYEAVASGAFATFNGMVGSTKYGYFDLKRDLDWWVDDLKKGGAGVLLANDKIAFDDADGPLVKTEVKASLERAETRTIAIKGTSFVTLPSLNNAPANDRSERKLRGVKCGFEYASAVQSVAIDATVTF